MLPILWLRGPNPSGTAIVPAEAHPER